ncbi:amino acid transporter [Coniochaeta ligniaria NRRL 30616]|uniref:Amino acid transporter n=1 Tax=Coniochaeta ligniaria NRRL 30616 TaxID=1408157 RepID=A0A1J7IS93_9PEZI|nr:amino acid transporter [Coniochaeta ligniaria NRRL 30616]
MVKVVSVLNGGPPGILYEFIAVSVMYCFVGASVAEIASAIPSSAGVYQWSAVVSGKTYGPLVSFYAGWWNTLAWTFSTVSCSSVVAQQIVQMYSLFHPSYTFQTWHVLVTYIVVTWASCLVVALANRALPALNTVGLFLIISGVIITIIVCAIMPGHKGGGYASNAFVWKDWQNDTGYSSNGLTFLMGMLNGAYVMGTPDCVSHLAEEIPRPDVNIPKAIAAQVIFGFVSTFAYIITLLYAISDLDGVVQSTLNFPLAQIYLQATGSRAGTLGLLVVICLPSFCACIAAYITAGRVLWALGRDGATPFSAAVGKIHPTRKNPMIATLVCGVVSTALGAIYVGSTTAFNAFVGSFVILLSLSYLAALVPHLATRSHLGVRGPFWIKGVGGFIVEGVSCAYLAVFVVIFCLPYTLPVTMETMNYSSAITGGLTVLITALWFWKRKGGYAGPPMVAAFLEIHEARRRGT